MAKVVAKKKKTRKAEIAELVSPEGQRKAERAVKKRLGELDDLADERYEYAMKLLEGSPEALEAVERAVETMGRMAGPPRFVIEGQAMNVEPEILLKIQRKVHTWAAVRLLVACAKWDIKIADFKPSKHICADCGVKVK